MILILSIKDDMSTSILIKWLIHFKKDFIRINKDDKSTKVNLRIRPGKPPELYLGDKKKIDLNSISAFWYRRGGLSIQPKDIPAFPNGILFEKEFQQFRKSEIKILQEYILSRLEELKSVNSFFTKSVNKLNILDLASKKGIDIPDTIITSQKKNYFAFLRSIKKLFQNRFSKLHLF